MERKPAGDELCGFTSPAGNDHAGDVRLVRRHGWQCFSHTEYTMRLVETVYKGKIRPWGKTRKSLGSVHVPKELADDLWLWKQRCPNPSRDAFIFPNKKGGFMDSNNYRNRVLHGLAQELELPKLTFQVIRRTIATLAQKKGTVKDIQGVLRHSRIATTTDVYMQEIPESVQKTVDAISAELRLLPNLEEVTRGTSVLLPNATKLKSGVSASN